MWLEYCLPNNVQTGKTPKNEPYRLPPKCKKSDTFWYLRFFFLHFLYCRKIENNFVIVVGDGVAYGFETGASYKQRTGAVYMGGTNVAALALEKLKVENSVVKSSFHMVSVVEDFK